MKLVRRYLGACIASALVLAQSPAIGQASAPASGPPAYRINPGDELEVLVWGDERLQREVRVLPDGTFVFPLVGQVTAGGLLPTQVQEVISTGLQPQYRGPVPQVTVSVKRPSGFQFSVIGKVRSPGTFTPGRYVNALEALSMAGGPTEFAQVGGIRIVRKVGGRLQSMGVSIGDTLRGGAGSVSGAEIPAIQSGDTVVVP